MATPDERDWTRRAFLESGLATGLVTGLAAGTIAESSFGSGEGTAPPIGPVTPLALHVRRRVLRFAHMTDIHLQPERGGDEGFAAALRHAQHSDRAVEMILSGGDLIMDGFEATEARTALQWDLFRRVVEAECHVPIEHTIGNHDIWGWNKSRSRTVGDENRWGKAWAREVLGLAHDHRTFVRSGWRFIVLDSVRPNGDGYLGYLGEAQLAWLRATLDADATSPTVIVSHIPLLTVTTLAGAKPEATNDLRVRGDLMHLDVQPVTALLRAHPNVKLCLSGHIHELDRIDYCGCSYVCGGAVSGAWWKGPHRGVPEGYGMVDLFDDGTFEFGYTPYGWNARPATE